MGKSRLPENLQLGYEGQEKDKDSDRNLIAELASRRIKLTDVGQDTPPIRVLLGADVLGRILIGRIEILASGISAIETLLGWTILGLGKKKQSVNVVTLALQNIELPKIWDLEVLEIKDPIERKNKSILAEETLLHFKETVKLKDLRYEVALPWLSDHPPVYNMHDMAESRLRSVTKRLVKEDMYKVYDDVLRQWQREAEFQNESLQPTVQKLKRGFYVDNLTVSVENEEELLRFKEQAMQIMNVASFELRSWAHTGIKHLESQNVLGLKWDTETDELYCVDLEADMGISDTISKRKLLSIVNSIYDPIGFTSPVTLLPKLLLQEDWRNKLDWDEELTPDMKKRRHRRGCIRDEVDAEQAPAQPKRRRVPPFFVTPRADFKVMLNICRLEAPSLKSSMSGKFLKLTVETDEEHRRLSRLLEAQGAEFKTFMLKTDRPIKVVIRGLPSCTPIEEIKEELEREGFTVVSITQLSKFQTKSPMPLFYAQIANGTLSETVYTLTEMFGTKISVERYQR
ncbi:hypothetical protein HNY73_009944 [Argiope bruennichi]|uniref:Pre-C2HC domain-containing protein n=1 Tax=Argiope bruennichi TaxID=94029 RepID=A0A8T0F737_ARGBR|nr:hypothetical protein HNY73_009944 [Argiope bruennichi]